VRTSMVSFVGFVGALRVDGGRCKPVAGVWACGDVVETTCRSSLSSRSVDHEAHPGATGIGWGFWAAQWALQSASSYECKHVWMHVVSGLRCGELCMQ